MRFLESWHWLYVDGGLATFRLSSLLSYFRKFGQLNLRLKSTHLGFWTQIYTTYANRKAIWKLDGFALGERSNGGCRVWGLGYITDAP